MNIFIICTVRNATKEYQDKLNHYVSELEASGHKVHLPHRDTDQTETGINICRQNRMAILKADEIHAFYNTNSQGTHFDLGMAFAMSKKIRIIENIEFGEGKSFPRMITEWENTEI
jgi:nucleoside 2-deoxyribosyltransferase